MEVSVSAYEWLQGREKRHRRRRRKVGEEGVLKVSVHAFFYVSLDVCRM